MRPIHTVYVVAFTSVLSLSAVQAAEVISKSIGDLYKESSELKGKQVQLQGKVVKVNNRIMKRNFLHLQDGSGDPADGSNDVTVTSQDTANVGDEVTVSGTVVVDQDFGYGYAYPLLIEQATVTPRP